MPLPSGHRIALSNTRRLMCDVVHFSQKIPAIVAERQMDLQPVIRARARLDHRPSWYAIFIKAYALVARDIPALRRYYCPFPWPHLHEHGCSVASAPICRQVGDEEAVLYQQLRQPDQEDLMHLHGQIERAKTAPVNSNHTFRLQLLLSQLPLPLRRLAWWVGLLVVPGLRLRYFGTFGITGVAGRGSDTTAFLSPLTTTVTFGVFQPDGQVTVRLLYDHRVMDGELIGRALRDLEDTLRGPIVSELANLADVGPAKLAA